MGRFSKFIVEFKVNGIYCLNKYGKEEDYL